MDQKTTLKDFFKPKAKISNNMEVSRKKSNLSLNKRTPTKSPKLSLTDKNQCHVIVIESDDEDFLSEPTFASTGSDILNKTSSDASDTTVLYTPGTPSKTTPVKSSQSSVSNNSTPKQNFYSPTKKRNLRRTPVKARKNLSNTLEEQNYTEDFKEICSGLDDKTVFMLQMINKYLKDESINHLLKESSFNLLQKCFTCSKSCLMLIRNLYWRKDKWFRLMELQGITSKKSHILEETHIKEVLETGIIIETNCLGQKNILTFDEYVAILKVKELKDVSKEFKIKSDTNKQKMIELLRSFIKQKSLISSYFAGTKTDNEARVLERLAAKAGACFKLSELMRTTLDKLYMLMYLGMDYSLIKDKKLEITLINDKANLQTFPYEKTVKTDNASIVFNTREDFERYRSAVLLYDDYLIEEDLNKKCERVRNVYELYENMDNAAMESYLRLPIWLRRFTPPHVYIKILEDGIKFLKKNGEEENICLTLEVLTKLIFQTGYRQHRKAEWYAEKALILDKFVSSSDVAAETLLEGFNSDLPEEDKDVLRPRAGLLAKRKTNRISENLKEALLKHAEKEAILERELNVKHIYKVPKENIRGGKIKFETRSEDGMMVQDAEEFCITHYIGQGRYTHGGHWEGRIISTVFFLLFWDVIYAKLDGVRGIIMSRFQSFPLDMFGDGFYYNRCALIQERLRHIERSTVDVLLEEMRRVWNERPECELSGINRQIGWDNVSMVCSCLGPGAVAVICRRLALNYRYTHSGFPDLTMWNVYTKKIAFVEVKTDSDKPSMKQIQWMHYLKGHGISTEFCYVGVNTTRCKARGREEREEE